LKHTISTARVKIPAILVIGMMAIAFAAIFFKFASPTHPLVSSGWRLALASALLLPWLIRAKRRGDVNPDFVKTALGCGFFYAIHFGAWVWSLELTSVAASVSLVTATPLLLAIWGVLTRKDAPTGQLWVALAVSTLGVFVISTADSMQAPGAMSGNLLAVLGAAGMAGYMLLVRRLGVFDVLAFGALATGTGALLLLGSALMLGESLAPASMEAAMFIALAALVPQMVGHNVITWVLRYTTPTVVGLATLIEPVGSTTLAWFLLNERPGAAVLSGCGLTLVGVALALAAKPR